MFDNILDRANFIKCDRCNGDLYPNICSDDVTKDKIISGLTCSVCSKNVATDDMSIAEYNNVVRLSTYCNSEVTNNE